MPERTSDDGFTLIELLVVVLVVGILVAIAAPKFLRARDGAAEAVARSNLTAAAKVQSLAWFRDGAFVADAAGLVQLEPELHWEVGSEPAAAGAVYAHLDTPASSELYLSARTPSGGCWYLRVTPGANGYGHSQACPPAVGAGAPTYATTW